jgi:hypothetical protein
MKASGFDGMQKAPLRSILHAKAGFAKRLFEPGRPEPFEVRDKCFAFGVAKGGGVSVADIAVAGQARIEFEAPRARSAAKAAFVGDTASIPWPREKPSGVRARSRRALCALKNNIIKNNPFL